MKWGIVIDSSCDLRTEDFKQEGIDFTVVPLKIIVGKKNYVDDDQIDVKELLEDMKGSKEASQTACPSPGDFLSGYMKSDQVFCFTLTGGLSGTNNSARIAKELALGEDSSKKVHVIDSKSTAGHLLLLMNRCVELIHLGKAFEDIAEELEEYNKELGIVFTLGSYDNLIKTGRMSNFAGAIASKLNIRLVCKNTAEGEIQPVKKIRGQRAAYGAMIEYMKEKKDLNEAAIYIHHCNNEKDAIYIREKIYQEFPSAKIEIVPCKGLTTFYAMEGGIIVGF